MTTDVMRLDDALNLIKSQCGETVWNKIREHMLLKDSNARSNTWNRLICVHAGGVVKMNGIRGELHTPLS